MNLSKKFGALMMALVMLTGFIPLATVKAEDPWFDQYCADNGILSEEGFWKIKSHNPLGQTFKPTKNRLSSVALAMSSGGADTSVSVRIVDVSTGLSVGSSSATVKSASTWYWFNFATPLTLDTAKTYKIAPITSSINAYWVVSMTPNPTCYANGVAYIDGTATNTQDFGFITVGYNEVPPAEVPAEEEAPATEGTSGNTASTTTPAVNIAQPDAAIAIPVLTLVTLNDEKEAVTADTLITMNADDELKMEGTTTEGTKVVIVAGLKTFEATVNGTTWSITLPVNELGTEEVLIQAQATKDGKGSEKAEFFRLKVAGATEEAAPIINQVESSSWNYWYTIAVAAAGVLVGFVAMFLWRFLKHRKDLKKGSKVEPKKPESTDKPVMQ